MSAVKGPHPAAAYHEKRGEIRQIDGGWWFTPGRFSGEFHDGDGTAITEFGDGTPARLYGPFATQGEAAVLAASVAERLVETKR